MDAPLFLFTSCYELQLRPDALAGVPDTITTLLGCALQSFALACRIFHVVSTVNWVGQLGFFSSKTEFTDVALCYIRKGYRAGHVCRAS